MKSASLMFARALGMALLLYALGAPSAELANAAFPGANGKIALVSNRD